MVSPTAAGETRIPGGLARDYSDFTEIFFPFALASSSRGRVIVRMVFSSFPFRQFIHVNDPDSFVLIHFRP